MSLGSKSQVFSLALAAGAPVARVLFAYREAAALACLLSALAVTTQFNAATTRRAARAARASSARCPLRTIASRAGKDLPLELYRLADQTGRDRCRVGGRSHDGRSGCGAHLVPIGGFESIFKYIDFKGPGRRRLAHWHCWDPAPSRRWAIAHQPSLALASAGSSGQRSLA